MNLDYKARARRAHKLRENKDFQGVLQDLREHQKDVFAKTAAHEVEQREEAHAILRAINEIEYLLQADINAEVFIDKGKAPQ
tara:strand:- start:1004 stop:1249 length:246 start_codon:yes stop_codon:yes gene_type:complete